MKKTHLSLLAVLAVWLALAVVAQAQESGDAQCDIDLSETISRLEAAQEAADSGDSERALRLMADARQQLAAFGVQCGGVDLSATYTLAVSGQGTLTFNYPAGWVTGDEEDDNVTIASSQTVLEEKSLFQPEPPPFLPGEVVINVALANMDFYGGAEDLDDDAPVQDVVALLKDVIQEEAQEISEIATLSIGDRRAARLDASAEGFGLIFILVELGRSGAGRQFGHVALLAEPGELPALEKLALRIAESFEFEAVSS